MPPALHSRLARAAEREGSSLNGYITSILSDTAKAGSRRSSRDRLLRIVLIADLALVAVAATVAIALLIAAWP